MLASRGTKRGGSVAGPSALGAEAAAFSARGRAPARRARIRSEPAPFLLELALAATLAPPCARPAHRLHCTNHMIATG